MGLWHAELSTGILQGLTDNSVSTEFYDKISLDLKQFMDFLMYCER